jgi:general stress protein YciG
MSTKSKNTESDATIATDGTGDEATPGSEAAAPRPKRPRGFAAMDRALVTAIASLGGKAAHSAGTAHEFTSEEAREAGRRGARVNRAKRLKGSDDKTGQ